ncbi:MAG TPA: hypothetical protein VHY84_27510 [Bryobacteraceae bacterium]|jgi:hypothetical protein|nr:hypothetical protein [Bryobacteraceae bacterium]
MTKTAVQIEIETCAGFRRAIDELANVASSRGTEVQRSANRAFGMLEATLEAEIEAWNAEDDKTEFPILALCPGADSWEPWAQRDKCDVYMTAAHSNGLCPCCLAAKTKWNEDEVER